VVYTGIMLRRQITFDEKVDARFVRRAQSQCWPWEGSLQQGRPAIGLRHVTRYIYEREIAPIPPGMRLIRTDHGPECRPRERQCEHFRCVNPWHLRVAPGRGGIYERDVRYDMRSSEQSAIYKRRVRTRHEKESTDDDKAEPANPEGLASE
jgi:hypothetical protein